MAGNTRGRLKERFEGIHKNLDWSIEHCNQSIILINAQPQPLSESSTNLKTAIIALAEGLQQFDKLAQQIYAKI